MGRVTAAWTVVAAPGANNYNKNLILTSYSKNWNTSKNGGKSHFHTSFCSKFSDRISKTIKLLG